MKDFVFLDVMLTPKIITFIYWLWVVIAVIGGIVLLFTGSLLTGLTALVGGIISARITCELLIVVFKIHENLKKIAETK